MNTNFPKIYVVYIKGKSHILFLYG